MDAKTYLDRVRYDGPTEPTTTTLVALHRAHMQAVPFENLDITLGHPLSLELPTLYDKIVTRRRGGFCYELNGLFAWLLGELGFEVAMLSARVFHNKTGDWGPEHDHMTLFVTFDETWVADVGFGDSFVEPFPFEAAEHVEAHRAFRVTPFTEGEFILEQRDDETWSPQYLFSRTSQALEDFSEMCRYQETDPSSPFRGRSICSLATPEGRISLAKEWLVETRSATKERRVIRDEAEYRTLLKSVFDIELNESVAPLMTPAPRPAE